MRKLTFLLLAFTMMSQLGLAQEKQSIKREAFSLQYPEGWTIDTEDEDYDPDALFSLDSPDEENMVMFIIFDMAVDADELMQEQINAFTAELIKKPTVTKFDTWGKFKGKGTMLSGKLMGVFKGAVRIFVYSEEERTMLVVEQYYDKAIGKLKKDYDLIANSFKFK